METNSHSFQKGVTASRKKKIIASLNELNEARNKRHVESITPFNQLTKKFRKELKPLLDAKELKNARSIVADFQEASAIALLKPGNSTDDEILGPVKRKFKTIFQKNFKEFSTISGLKRNYRGEFDKLNTDFRSAFAFVFDHIAIDLSNIFQTRKGKGTHFRPPFEFGDYATFTNINFVDEDHSRQILQTGLVTNEIHFRHHGGGSFNPIPVFESFSAMGINFQMQKTGIIRATITAQNTRSLLQATIEDNFGFSDGNVEMSTGIFIDVIHPNNVGINQKVFSTLTLSTGGDDVFKSQENIQAGTPFKLVLQSTGAFAAGDTLQIMIGSNVRMRSDMDDMTSTLETVVAWQIKDVFIQVI
ncbi:MAG: hypothetical protein ABIQ02_03575 [Saprospiraceae bacterium]